VILDAAPEHRVGWRRTAIAKKMKHGFSVFPGKFDSLPGTAGQRRINRKDNRGARIPDVPFRAFDIAGAGRFLQLVSGINWTILGQSALGTPAAVRNSMFNSEIQCGAASAGLAASGRYYAGFRSAPNPKGPPSLRTQPFMGR